MTEFGRALSEWVRSEPASKVFSGKTTEEAYANAYAAFPARDKFDKNQFVLRLRAFGVTPQYRPLMKNAAGPWAVFIRG